MTLSKERLEEIARVSAEFLAEEERINGKADLQVWLDEVWPGVALEMARELLELRERDKQEPVAYIFKHPAGKLFWALSDESNKHHDDVMPVYAAPPAPVVQPVQVPSSIADIKLKKALLWIDGVIRDNPGMKEAVTCRAAMLQSFGNSEQLNSSANEKDE